MKRDNKLINDIMSTLEETEYGTMSIEEITEKLGHSDNRTIEHHIVIMIDVGYLALYTRHPRLTWAGHDHLDKLRKAKEPAAKTDLVGVGFSGSG